MQYLIPVFLMLFSVQTVGAYTSATQKKQTNWTVKKSAEKKIAYKLGVGRPTDPKFLSFLIQNFNVSIVDFLPGSVWVFLPDKTKTDISGVIQSPKDTTASEQGSPLGPPKDVAPGAREGHEASKGVGLLGDLALCEVTKKPQSSLQPPNSGLVSTMMQGSNPNNMSLWAQCPPEECRGGAQDGSGTQRGGRAESGGLGGDAQNGSVAQRGNRTAFGDSESSSMCGRATGGSGRSSPADLLDPRRAPGQQGGSQADSCEPYKKPGYGILGNGLSSELWSRMGADPRRSAGGDGNTVGNMGRQALGAAAIGVGEATRIWEGSVLDKYPNATFHGKNPDGSISPPASGDEVDRFLGLVAIVPNVIEGEKEEPEKGEPEKGEPGKQEPPKQEPPKTEPPKTETPKADPPKEDKPDVPSGGAADPADPRTSCHPEIDSCVVSTRLPDPELNRWMEYIRTRYHRKLRSPFDPGAGHNPLDKGPQINPGPGDSPISGGGLPGSGGPDKRNPIPWINPGENEASLFCHCGTCSKPIIGEAVNATTSINEICKRANSEECDGRGTGTVINTDSQPGQGGTVPGVPGVPSDLERPVNDDDDDDEND